MAIRDGQFDIVYCSHVLEHVSEDRKAIRELWRVLRNGGLAIVLVPVMGDRTLEDPLVTDPSERKKLFGQEDHVRRYGRDFVDRLREAGFTVAVTGVFDLASREEAVRMGLSEASGEVYRCIKAGAADTKSGDRDADPWSDEADGAPERVGPPTGSSSRGAHG